MKSKTIYRDINNVLTDLLMIEDIQACLLATGKKPKIIPKNVKIKNLRFWQLIKETTSEFFSITDEFYRYNLSKIYFELEKYEIIMSFIDSETALIVVIPRLANKGLLEVEIENARRFIKTILS